METLVLIVHVLLAAAIIGLVLLQQGKGAEAGASFGAGASQTVFGSTGNSGFMVKITALVAAVLFATSFALAYFAKERASNVNDAGIPSMQVIESAAERAEELPALEVPSSSGAASSSDIPTAE
ncbi:preprotein translocase subunit SecG [Nitrincola iocasae]|jgi:preprotein translocase subunit SecG|uniref:Protein-export membrane protein SecG n=1 Tax=Nitrincola iocasae TaxID=2614693 RepID=A0A5J6LB11_9GAMM|nr:preprotein translocase subunit SecG [Nitrincola iocasae]QEW05498.1 preprotein translocase subunit SecG [Nitrincola iocasae]